ncbi:MAG: MFS transporter [Gemmatimonadaceae bacterium]
MESHSNASAPIALPPLTPTQWLICAVAGLGFAFDLYETLMGALIVGPVLTSLGGMVPGSARFNSWVGLFFVLPAVAGGAFGLLGGYLTDRFGRRRVLVWSILLYGCSAGAAGFATSLPMLLVLRCATMIGVFVEAVAAVAWLAELFPVPRQRELVLAYAQSCYAFGGLMVSGAYYLAVTHSDSLPALLGHHDAWRYTLLSGLIPAVPLMIVRPFLPESPMWRERKKRTSPTRTSIAALFASDMRRTTLLTTLMMACTLAIPYGALQQTPRVVPGLIWLQGLGPRQIEQAVSRMFLVQELGSVVGRVLFAVLVVRVVQSKRLLQLFLMPAAFLLPWLFLSAPTGSPIWFIIGVFGAQVLFNGMHSFWGNYLPRVFPTSVRGTGEAFAMNVGGRMIGVCAALATTHLANVTSGALAATRLARAAGTTMVIVLAVFVVASVWLPEPRDDALPQ